MKTADMTGRDPIDSYEASSKGNQPKWFADGMWYKADHMGYEGLAETVISRLLEKSSVSDFVKYSPVLIKDGSRIKTGCVSSNFRRKDEEIITLEKLFRAYEGISINRYMLRYPSAGDKISFAAEFVEKHTGLENAGAYFTAMLELDAFFLNEDRHTNNITFIRNAETGVFRYCSFFDFGLGLLSDLTDYKENEDIYSCIARIGARPFSTGFDEQTDAAEERFGRQLKIFFDASDIKTVLSEAAEYYPPEILSRVEKILREQLRKYLYLRA